jgi:hypothetical protein
MKRPGVRILIAAGIMAVLLNITLAVTYPINIGQSDNPNYLAMMLAGASNLIHASGYPAVLYLVTHPFFPTVSIPHGRPSEISADWYNELQRVQLLLHAALFSIAIVLCLKMFGQLAAAILTLGWGCNILFMSGVNATAPEWLQADVLILSLMVHVYARTVTVKRKVIFYCFGAALFALAYLIKYNSALFAVALVGLLLLDNHNWRLKALQSFLSLITFLMVTTAYAHLYHQRSTGTSHLSFDHAWVMIEALPAGYLSASPEELGVSTLHWIALSASTPPEYFRARAITNIDYGAPEDIRRPYREQWQAIFRMSKPELIQFVKAHPLPSYYRPGSAAVPLYYYYGLPEIDALGIQVYEESLRSDWRDYLKRIGVDVADLLLHEPSIHPVPTFKNPLGYRFLPPVFSTRVFGISRIVPPSQVPDPYFLPYYNPSETVLFYGVKTIEKIEVFTSVSSVYLALNLISLLGLLTLRSASQKVTALCVMAGLMAFISGSAMLLGMRAKEIITITPIYFLLISVGLSSAWHYIHDVIVRERLYPVC